VRIGSGGKQFRPSVHSGKKNRAEEEEGKRGGLAICIIQGRKGRGAPREGKVEKLVLKQKN